MKRIGYRVDKWEYSGGHVGHLWQDLQGEKHNSISDIMEGYSKRTKQTNFHIDWKAGELFVDEQTEPCSDQGDPTYPGRR